MPETHRYFVSLFVNIHRPAISRFLSAWLGLLVLSVSFEAQAAVSIYMPPEALAQRSPWIVEGTVQASRSGFDPQTGSLATYVTLAVEMVHRGPSQHETIVIREAGGRYAGLVHETDAVPVYQAGERVFVFLEPARDGALRTSGMFFGKFAIEDDPEGRLRWAGRDLDGQGTIVHRPAQATERFVLGDLVALANTVPARAATRVADGQAAAPSRVRTSAELLPVPPEYDRLLWDDDTRAPASQDLQSAAGLAALVDPLSAPDTPTASATFRPLSLLWPSRWLSPDLGHAVVVNIDRARNPLGDGAAAATEILRAMAAWSEVPESRFTFVAGDTDFDYAGTYAGSPAKLHTGTNVVLFDDPYNDISNPSGCSGVLAIGGYWRTEDKYSTVNGVEFHSAVQLYVIFSNDFECVLGVPDDLAEIATHELGHGIGIGHSVADDAIMRSSPYRFRGPRLGLDDRDAAHCCYPHTFRLDKPNGGEIWEAGRSYSIEWSATSESGPDPGLVSLEYSTDGGAIWSTIADDVLNDGSHTWTVPPTVNGPASVRVVRHSQTGVASSPFPEECSSDASDAEIEIVPWAAEAGVITAGSAFEGGLTLSKAYVEGWVVMNWGASCSADATDYAVYEGDLDKLREGTWNHAPATCSTASDLDETVFTGTGSRYFLVASVAGAYEGHLGHGLNDALRPASASACAIREASPTCE